MTPSGITSISGDPPDVPPPPVTTVESDFPEDLRAQLKEGSPYLKADRLQENPVVQHEAEIMDAIINYEELVLIGGTGSGKTTNFPFMLDEFRKVAEEAGIILPGKIAITQPRKAAARQTAETIAEIAGCALGTKVGYQVKDKNLTGDDTVMNVMTEGILLRKIESDPLLMEYSIIMVDEAHERGTDADLLIALILKINETRRSQGIPAIRLAITSATIEEETFRKVVTANGKGGVINIEGKKGYNINETYLENDRPDFTQAAAEKVRDIVKENRPPPIKNGEEVPEDVLIFMPGERHINDTIARIRAELTQLYGEEFVDDYLHIVPFYGNLDGEDQKIATDPSPIGADGARKRKIVVATNIAETSLTLRGLKHVIDSGLINQTAYNEVTGVESVKMVMHSRAGLAQRRGRLGRESDGDYHALFTLESKNSPERPEFQKAEIFRKSPAQLILKMKGLGIDDIENFRFIEAPKKEAIRKALHSLRMLGALDENDKLTAEGRFMYRLGLPPEHGKMMLKAIELGSVDDMMTVVGFLNARRVFDSHRDTGDKEKDKAKKDEIRNRHILLRQNASSDLLGYRNIWKQYIDYNQDETIFKEWTKINAISMGAFRAVAETRKDIAQILRGLGIAAENKARPELIDFAVMKAAGAGHIRGLLQKSTLHTGDKETYYEQVFPEDPNHRLHKIHVDQSSNIKNVGNGYFLTAGEIREADGKPGEAYAATCQAIPVQWLPQIAERYFTENIRDVRTGRNEVERTTLILANSTGKIVGRVVERLSDDQVRQREQYKQYATPGRELLQKLIRQLQKDEDFSVEMNARRTPPLQRPPHRRNPGRGGRT